MRTLPRACLARAGFLLLVVTGLIAGTAPHATAGTGASASPLRLVGTIPIPGATGRIDHMALDSQSKRLFIAALGSGAVAVVDLGSSSVIGTIAGFQEPQGILYIPGLRRLLVTDGGDGACHIIDADSLRRVGVVRLSGDADNIRFDPAVGLAYVGHGEGGLASIDPNGGTKIGEIELGSHPESFQLQLGSTLTFVNLPARTQVAVVDREKGAVLTHWSVGAARGNFAMAIDEAGGRLFVATRTPPKLLVLNASTGKLVATIPIDGDADDVFYDAPRRLLYVSCGAGSVCVIEQTSRDRYRSRARISTARGARTCLFSPDLGRLFVAVPAVTGRPAEIRVYEATR